MVHSGPQRPFISIPLLWIEVYFPFSIDRDIICVVIYLWRLSAIREFWEHCRIAVNCSWSSSYCNFFLGPGCTHFKGESCFVFLVCLKSMVLCRLKDQICLGSSVVYRRRLDRCHRRFCSYPFSTMHYSSDKLPKQIPQQHRLSAEMPGSLSRQLFSIFSFSSFGMCIDLPRVRSW